jgi:hypothetical protein
MSQEAGQRRPETFSTAANRAAESPWNRLAGVPLAGCDRAR